MPATFCCVVNVTTTAIIVPHQRGACNDDLGLLYMGHFLVDFLNLNETRTRFDRWLFIRTWSAMQLRSRFPCG